MDNNALQQTRQALPRSHRRRRFHSESGWLLVADAYLLIASADYDAAVQLLACAAEDGSRHHQTDIVAFATMIWGRAPIKAGRLKEGLGPP